MLAVSYQIFSGLLDTFPSATREIRVLDLDEITVNQIIAFMKKLDFLRILLTQTSFERGTPASPTETYPISHQQYSNI
ncbi:hypothetical protein OUZ56_012720 [Daphnia magna]|uniref:Uncharacterized protein n=1 Tax=Daphnia magna TaxID=35525 RepID=A0ABQ9Z3V8_9CRUS|nr:hypothetical protein OUZ56_012720 [Daphnia magna]